MIDNNCIHVKVCDHVGFACESCDKCKFKEHYIVDEDNEVVSVDKLMKAIDAHKYYIYDSSEGVVGYTPFQIEEAARSVSEPTREIVGICIEHEWAEEDNGLLISNFECPYCGEWHREVDQYCSHCGKPIKIVQKERKKP